MKNKTKWILTVFILSFILSVIFSGISTAMTNNFHTIILVLVISYILRHHIMISQMVDIFLILNLMVIQVKT